MPPNPTIGFAAEVGRAESPWSVSVRWAPGAEARLPVVLSEPEDRGLRPRLHVELRQQGGHVVLDGLLRQPEAVTDLPVGQSVGDVPQHLTFAKAEGAHELGRASLGERGVQYG